MTFYAPRELPVVTIGVYYERGESQRIRDTLTGSALGLQAISDVDEPLHPESGRTDVQASDLPAEQLAWFAENRQAIVEFMRLSPQGAALGRKYDVDFTSRVRPVPNSAAALVIYGGTYSGIQVPSTVITQRLIFVN